MSLSKKEANKDTGNPVHPDLNVIEWNRPNNRKTKILELPQTLEKKKGKIHLIILTTNL